MAIYEFQQKVVSEYRVEAATEEEARERLEDDPGKYLVDSYLDYGHDQETFFLVRDLD
jgi:hypothetical protein